MATPNTTGSLPDYDHPPVIETILGVQFDPLPDLRNAHLGAFWGTLDATEWAVPADAPPLPNQSEQFSESGTSTKGIQLLLSQAPPSRLQIKNRAADRMIQVQNGRLHFNWLGEGGANYPRYVKVKDEFKSVLQRFLAFLNQSQIAGFQPNQWEVTYVNQIPQGTAWKSPADWEFFLPLRGAPTIEGLIQAESFSGEWHFVIPPQAGRLHIAWQHARKEATAGGSQEELVQITLTARGPLPADADPMQSLFVGLELGHRTIVRAFASLMSAEANSFWGLKNVDH